MKIIPFIITIFLLACTPSNKVFKNIHKSLKKREVIKTLDLSYGDLSYIGILDTFTNLEELFLNGNNLEELPQSVCNLKKLKTLRLSYNNLKRLPSCFSQLKNLEYLNLAHNPINSIQEIKKMKHLKVLYILDTELSNDELDELSTTLSNTLVVTYLHY